ncbi:MAG: hypothetical protein ABI591_09885, partial [Kofleriaceae bacterium]
RVFVMVATLCLGVAVASADATTPQEKSKVLFEEGRKLIEAHDDLGACGKFNEAIKLDPDAAGTMLNLGLCNQNLKKIRLALFWFRKAQARAHETNLPEYEAAAGIRTRDLVDLVASVKLDVSPDDAHVKLDGEEISSADYLHVEVDVGHHVIEARSPGHQTSHQEFDVVGKGGETIEVKLAVGDDMIDVDHPGRRKAGLITAGAGVGLMIASGVVNLLARSSYIKCVDGGFQRPDPSCAQTITDAQHHALYVGTSLFVGGALAVVAGGYLYFTAHQHERVNQTVFLPTVSADGAGFAAIGRF